MGKLIAFADLHLGSVFERHTAQDVAILGDWAIPMHRAVQKHARDEKVSTMLDVGDRSNYGNEAAARKMADITNQAAQTIYTSIGNHDPYELATELGFNTDTQIIEQDELTTTNLITCRLIKEDVVAGQIFPNYGYDSQAIGRLISQKPQARPAANQLFVSHWAFDRLIRGYPASSDPKKGYVYHDNLEVIRSRLSQLQESFALSVHGHEHRFRMNKYGRYTSLVLPSMVQEDVDDKEKDFSERRPCALFSEILEKPNGQGLHVEFKKVVIPEKAAPDTFDPETAKIISVDFAHMQQYERPVLKAA